MRQKKRGERRVKRSIDETQTMEITLEKRIPTTRYRPDHQTGLTAQQVQEHRMHGWTNQPVDPPSKTTKEIIQENVFTYFNLIFLVLAVLLCLVGSFRDLTFLPVIVLNTLIGIIQETRAKKVLDNLTMLNAPHAMVIRDGKKSQINAEDLVVDDIVIFEAGNQVCADAEVCAGEVQVNESLLTGESDEITKRKGDQLMSGSFIVSGQCHARLDKVGADSYISRLTLEAKAMQNTEQSFSGQAGQMGRRCHHSNRDYFVYSGICISGRRVPIQCDVHDRGRDRNDPRRAVSACQCGACSKFDPSGTEKSIAA